MLEALPGISKIFSTYQTALTGLVNALNQMGLTLAQLDEGMSANGIKYLWDLHQRTIEIILLYPASRSRQTRKIKNQQYAHYL